MLDKKYPDKLNAKSQDPEINPFLEMLDKKYPEQDQNRVSANAWTTKAKPASQTANDLALSQSTGLEIGLVERNRDRVLTDTNADRLQDLTKDRNVLSRFMKDPINLALSQDDVEKLASLEDFFQGKQEPPFKEYSVGLYGTDKARLYRLKSEGLARGLDPITAEREAVLRSVAYLKERSEAVTKPAIGTAKSSVKAVAKLLPMTAQTGFSILGSAAGVIDEATKSLEGWGMGQRGGYFGALRDSSFDVATWLQKNVVQSDLLSLPKELQKPLIDNPELLLNPEWLVSNIGDAAGSMAIMIGTAIASGGGSETASFLGGTMEGSDLYRELIQDGVDETSSMYASMAFGYVVTRLEKIGLDRILGKERVNSAGKALVKSLISGLVEGGTEYLEEPFQGFIGAMAKTDGDLSKSFDAFLKGFKNVDVIPGAMLTGGSMAFVGRYRQELATSKAAEENKQFFQAINQKVEGIQLRSLAPDRFKVYAQQIQEMESVPESVFIPVDQLQAAMGSEADFMDFLDSAGLMDQLATAQAEKGDIEIPMSEFLARIAGTDAALKLENDFRFSPNQMTPREATEWKQRHEEVFAADIERAVHAAESMAIEIGEATEVMNHLNNAITAVGLDSQVADANAAIWAARAQVAAQGFSAAGQPMTPMQWLEGKNLVIRNDVNGAEVALNGRAMADSDGVQYDQAWGINHENGHTTQSDSRNVNTGILNQDTGNRGQVEFSQNQTLITLFESANKSTFAHESGHIFFEDLQTLASFPNAPEQIKKDWSAIVEYLGVEGDITTEQHEKFARSFEAYLREGKAPSQDLQSAFRQFKAWLTKLYKTILKLDAPINDEIRSVMDRMLATEEMINDASEQIEGAHVYRTAEEAGMTEEGFAEYLAAYAKSKETAKEILLKDLYKDIENRNKQFYRDKRDDIFKSVVEDLYDKPEYKALFYLQNGYLPQDRENPPEAARVPLNTDAIIELGYDPAKLSKSVPPIYSRSEGSLHPDVMADLMGFSSGQALLHSLTGLEPIKKAATRITNQRMDEYKDILSSDTIKTQALEAIENEARVDLLILERDIAEAAKRKEINRVNFAQRAREAAEKSRAIRVAARAAIGRMKTTEAVKVSRHQQAERKAGREAIEAAKKGDMEKVKALKERQTIAAALASEAAKAGREIDTSLRYLKKFNSPGTRKNLAREYLDQIDNLLEGYEFKKSTTLKELGRREGLADFIAKQSVQGFAPNIPTEIQNKMDKISYKELTLDEFIDLKNAVKSIETIARLKQTLLTSRDKRTFKEKVEQLKDATIDAFGDKLGPEFIPRELEGKKSWLASIDADLSKVEFMMNVLDGGRMTGAWWEAIYRPVNDGVNQKSAMFEKITKDLFNTPGKLFGAYSGKELSQMRSKKIFIKEIGYSLTKEQIIAVALNRGNGHNWTALWEGEQWTPKTAESVLSYLDERDWQFVEDSWIYIDTFWPQIAALYKKLTGVVPEKVQGEPFVNPLGREMKGGYYPLVADHELNVRAGQREDAKNVQEMFGGGGFRPSTRNGHIEKRKGFGGQRVSFSLNVLVRHLDQVSQDLCLREAVIDVDRLIQNPTIQNTIIRALGKAQYDQLRPWLAAVAGQKEYDYDSVEAVAKFFRKNATMAVMGLKASIAISQYAGLSNAIPLITNNTKAGRAKIGAMLLNNLRRGFRASYSDIGKQVEEKSLELRDRRHNFVQEATDLGRHLGTGKKVKAWQEAMMYFTGLADYHVSIACWKTAYDLSLKDGKTEQQSIDFADSVVRLSQGTGKTKDLAGIQRGGEWKKMWMMFYSYLNTNYGQLSSSGKVARISGRKGRFIGDMAFYLFFPAIMAELMAGRGPDDDKDENPASWALKTILTQPLGMVPLVRDAISLFDTDYGRPVSLIGRVGASSKALYDEIKDDDGDDAALFWKAIDTAGYFVPYGMPSGQMRITGRQVIEFMNDERDDFSPFLYRKAQ